MSNELERVARAMQAASVERDSYHASWGAYPDQDAEFMLDAEAAIAALIPTQVVDPGEQLLRDIFEAPTPDVDARSALSTEGRTRLAERNFQSWASDHAETLLDALDPHPTPDVDVIAGDTQPGCTGDYECPAPAHQHGCMTDVEGHCNEPEAHPASDVLAEVSAKMSGALDDALNSDDGADWVACAREVLTLINPKATQ